MNADEMEEALFFQLVMGLESSAWIALGKVKNPFTDKVERDLNQAKAIIDTLVMLKKRTKGNLAKQEDELLSNALQELQINYVDEMNKPGKTGEESNKEKRDKTKESTSEK